MARAFAPILAKNGGGAIINVLSVASWMNGPRLATYGASKSAEWALTNGLRIELAQQGTQVVAVHAGFIDTDLARNFDAPKSSPEEIVRTTLNALERGESQVLADEISRQVHRGLSADFPVYFRAVAALRSRWRPVGWLSRRTAASTQDQGGFPCPVPLEHAIFICSPSATAIGVFNGTRKDTPASEFVALVCSALGQTQRCSRFGGQQTPTEQTARTRKSVRFLRRSVLSAQMSGTKFPFPPWR